MYGNEECYFAELCRTFQNSCKKIVVKMLKYSGKTCWHNEINFVLILKVTGEEKFNQNKI